MKRRTLLAALGTGAAGLAGCLGRTPPGSGGDPNATDAAGSTTPSRTAGASTTPRTAAATGTSTTGRGDRSRPCPPFDGDTPTVCSSDGPVGLTASSGSGDSRTLTFTLANAADDAFRANFYAWSLRKRSEGGWYRVAPRAIPQPLHELSPGDAHEWTFEVDNDPPIPIRHLMYSENGGTVGGLGPGEYAFGISGVLGDGVRKRYLARVSLPGEPLDLHPTPDASVVGVEGDTLVVDGGEDTLNAVLVAVDGDAAPLLVETAYQFPALRDTLGLVAEYDVSRVRLRGDGELGMVLGSPDAPWRRFGYGGTTYELREANGETGDE